MIIISETGNLVFLQNCVDVFVICVEKNVNKDENESQKIIKEKKWCVCCTTAYKETLKLGTYSTEELAEKCKMQILNILSVNEPVYMMPKNEDKKIGEKNE